MVPAQATRTAAPLTRSALRSRRAASAAVHGVGRGRDAQVDAGRLGQELLPVLPGVGRDTLQRPLLEEMVLVIEDRDVAEMDARDGQRPAAVERGQRGWHQGADGCEEDGRVEWFRRRASAAPALVAPSSSASACASADRVMTWTRAPWASATCAVMCAEPPNP